MRAAVLELLKKNYTPREVAVYLEMAVADVTAIMQEEKVSGWGAPEHYACIISRRLPGSFGWPEANKDLLAEMKAAHDAGVVSMVQKKDAGYIVQYAFPNPEPVKRRLWFTAPPETY